MPYSMALRDLMRNGDIEKKKKSSELDLSQFDETYSWEKIRPKKIKK